MRKYFWVVLVLFFQSTALFACDVNLVAIMSGQNPNDVFGAMVLKLASEARSVGQSVSELSVAEPRLQTLMKSWVEFDNKFSQTPPDWGRGDKEWSAKIKSMADLIGVIHTQLKAKDENKLHGSIVQLTRKLIGLFDAMPMSNAKRQLATLFHGTAALAESREHLNTQEFENALASLSIDLQAFRKELATDVVPLTNDFSSRLDQLKQVYQRAPGTFSFELNLAIPVTDESLKAMNEKLLNHIK